MGWVFIITVVYHMSLLVHEISSSTCTKIYFLEKVPIIVKGLVVTLPYIYLYDIVRDLVHLEEDVEENAAGVSSDPLAYVRTAV